MSKTQTHNRNCIVMIQGRIVEKNRVLIWKAEGRGDVILIICIIVLMYVDALTLRRSHRIVGNFVGALPCQPHQNIWLGLPLELLPEETTLLLEQGAFICLTTLASSLMNQTTFTIYRQKSSRDTI